MRSVTDDNLINQVVALFMGLCWHEKKPIESHDGSVLGWRCAKCGEVMPEYPSFFEDKYFSQLARYLVASRFDDVWIPFVRERLRGIDVIHAPGMVGDFIQPGATVRAFFVFLKENMETLGWEICPVRKEDCDRVVICKDARKLARVSSEERGKCERMTQWARLLREAPHEKR